jgi:hypothetical protein
LERRDTSQLLGEDEDDEMDDAEGLGSEEEEPDSDESSEASDGENSSDPSADEEVDPELRRKIEEALRVNGIEPATGETDSEEEELMDDDQMIAIDEQLAQVFRARANEKKGKGLFSRFASAFFVADVSHVQTSTLNAKLHISKAESLTWWTLISGKSRPVPWCCTSSPLWWSCQ